MCRRSSKNTRAMSSRWPVDLSPCSRRREWNVPMRSAAVGRPRRSATGRTVSMTSSRAIAACPGTLFRTCLQNAPGSRRQVNRFEISTAQRLGQHFDLVGGGLIAIDDEQVLLAQPAGAAARAITDLPQDLFATHLDADPLGRFGQLVDQPQNTSGLDFAHR